MAIYTFHERFFISIFKTLKVTGYGVYVEFGEALRSHHWFLIKGLIQKPKREALEEEVKDLSETVGRDSSYGAGHPLLSKQFLLPDQNYLGKSPCRKGTEPHQDCHFYRAFWILLQAAAGDGKVPRILYSIL
jgi:hypothetical protein